MKQILKHFEEHALGWVLGISTLIAFYETMLRYVVGTSTVWAEEINRYLLILLVMVGASVVLKRDGHVRMTILHDCIGTLPKKYLDLLCQLIIFAFSCIRAYLSFVYVYNSLDSGYRSSTPLMVYLWIPQVSLCIGLLLIPIRSVQRIFSLIDDIRSTTSRHHS